MDVIIEELELETAVESEPVPPASPPAPPPLTAREVRLVVRHLAERDARVGAD